MTKMRDIISKIDEHICYTTYRLLYDSQEVDIDCRITTYYLVTGVLPIQIIKLNNILYYLRDMDKDMDLWRYGSLIAVSSIQYYLKNIVLHDVNYSYTGMPKLIKIAKNTKWKYGCRCILTNNYTCFHDHIEELQSNTDDICCNIFQLHFVDLCDNCIYKLYYILRNIARKWEYPRVSLIRNELTDIIITRFKNCFHNNFEET